MAEYWSPTWYEDYEFTELLLPEELEVWEDLREWGEFERAGKPASGFRLLLGNREWPWTLVGRRFAPSVGIGPPDDLLVSVPRGEVFLKRLTQMRASLVVETPALNADQLDSLNSPTRETWGPIPTVAGQWVVEETLALLSFTRHATPHDGSRFLTQLDQLKRWEGTTGKRVDPFMSRLVCLTADESLGSLGLRAEEIFEVESDYVERMVLPLEEVPGWWWGQAFPQGPPID